MPVTRITSVQNALYKQVKHLIADRAFRRERGEFAAEGRRLFADAVASGLMPKAVLLSEKQDPAEYDCLGAPVYVLPQAMMTSLSDTKTPQGVAGVFPVPHPSGKADGEKLLMLCSLQDPGNVGTILRTAEAFGISQVLLSEDCPDLYSPKVLRASMGGVFRMACETVRDVPDTIRTLRKAGFCVYAAALEDGACSVEEADLSGKVCVLIGNEGNGLPGEVIASCDGALLLPMRGRAQSLNAAMAAGIFIWEMTKARGTEDGGV